VADRFVFYSRRDAEFVDRLASFTPVIAQALARVGRQTRRVLLASTMSPPPRTVDKTRHERVSDC
jgi:hypothetical protein